MICDLGLTSVPTIYPGHVSEGSVSRRKMRVNLYNFMAHTVEWRNMLFNEGQTV